MNELHVALGFNRGPSVWEGPYVVGLNDANKYFISIPFLFLYSNGFYGKGWAEYDRID
jgi:hypothetical protein